MNSTDQPRTGNPGCYSQGKDYVYKLIETKSIACWWLTKLKYLRIGDTR